MYDLPGQMLLPKSRARFCQILILLLCCCFAESSAFADDRATLRLFTQDFYKAYAANSDPAKFIAKSDKITPGFKKAYTAFMKKEQGYDPVIQGQDVPSAGYESREVELTDDTHAKVTMIPRDKGFTTLKVYVMWNGKAWLLNGVNGLKGK
jgi:hypothetical protein